MALGLALTVCTGIVICWVYRFVAKIVDFFAICRHEKQFKSPAVFDKPLMTLPALTQLTCLYCSQTPNSGPYPSQRSQKRPPYLTHNFLILFSQIWVNVLPLNFSTVNDY
jgi:hypothetical protein